MSQDLQVTGFVTIVVDESQIEAARLMMQAIDPDTGGYDSFLPANKDGLYVCSMPADAATMAKFETMKTNPDKMLEEINLSLTTRFKVQKEAADQDLLPEEEKKRYAVPEKAILSDITNNAVFVDGSVAELKKIDAEFDIPIKIGPVEVKL